MWFFDFALTEEEVLKEKIIELVEEIKIDSYDLYNWIKIQSWWFTIHLETLLDWKYISSSSYVEFNWKIIFNKEKDEGFFKNLVRVVHQKNNLYKEKLIQENKISRSLLITEALASLTQEEVNNASKEVKDEFAPIFKDVRRVQEITKELESIRQSYITI